MTKGPAPRPCDSCPYRSDVPSGIWERSEYEKLPHYDGETFEQPPSTFGCHLTGDRLCAGWVGCHDMAESLSMRLAVSSGRITKAAWDAALAYVSPIPLFSTGAEAARHGLEELDNPSPAADKIIRKLLRSARWNGSSST